MSWNDLYTADGVRAQDANLVSQWERKIAAAGLATPDKLHNFASHDLAEDLVKHRLLLAYQMGLGKGHTLDTNVLTPSGYRTVGSLAVGDEIIGSDGKAHLVSGVFPRGTLPVFRVVMSDESSVICDEDHLWAVKTPWRRNAGSDYRVLDLRTIRASLAHKNGNRQHFIPMVKPIEFPERTLPIDPYLLGLLLGDGGLSRKTPQFTTADPDLLTSVTDLLPEGIRPVKAGKYGYSLSAGGTRGRPNPLTAALRALDLMGKRSEAKSIPEIYRFAPVAARVALLQGLLDTDGFVNKTDGNIEYSSSSRALAEDFRWLVESLGGTARIVKHITKRLPSYRMNVILSNEIIPFRLARKLARWQPRTKYLPNRSIMAVEPVGEAEVVCIRVDAPDALYVTERAIVTHNTALAIAAAAVRGTKHSLFVVPNKLIDEWRKEFVRLGFGDQYALITSLSQINGYRCPAGCGEINSFRQVLDQEGNILDVERTCESCGARAQWYDRLPRFAIISLRSLWTIPKDSPHYGREKKPEKKNANGQVSAPARNRMKYTFAHVLRRRCEFVVVDEAYNLANPNALQTRAVFMLSPRRKWLLTGTPVRGYPEQVLSLLNWCLGTGSDLFPEYDSTQESSLARFVEAYGTKIVKRRANGSTYEKYVPKISNPERFQALLAPVMRRRVNLEPETAKAIKMPNFMISPEQIELDPNLRALYEQCVKDFVVWWAQVQADAARTGVPVPSMTLLSKLTYLARLATVPQAMVSYDGITSKQARILALTKDAIARGRKVIIFSEFVSSVEWFAASPLLAKYKPVVVTGTVSLDRSKRTGNSERERRLDTFRKGDSQLLIATTNCMAEGYNLPEAGTVLFDSFGWVPSVMQQAWSRVLRPAQKHDPVEIHLVGAAGTIDELLLAINQLKRSAIGEGIDYEQTEFDLDDVPDPHVYANALVEASTSVDRTYGTIAWIDRLKRQAASATAPARR